MTEGSQPLGNPKVPLVGVSPTSDRTVREFYREQAKTRVTGAVVGKRISIAAHLFARHAVRSPDLLDIGCGIGAVARHLCRALNARSACGVDIAEERVRAATELGIRAQTVDLNSEPLPYPAASFDAVFCGEVLEHLVDPDHLLDEIWRVLRPGAVCVLTTPNLASWINRIALVLGWQPFSTSVSYRYEVGRPRFLVSSYGCRDHLRVFTMGALTQTIRLHGFELLDVRGLSLTALLSETASCDGAQWARSVLARAVAPVDLALARSPQFACGLVVAVRRPL